MKTDEHRVAITPDGVLEMRHRGVTVLVERDAGADSGITDDDYRAAGARRSSRTPRTRGAGADLVLKVKEPQASECGYLRADLTLFTYLHLAAYPDVGPRAARRRAPPASPTRRCSSRTGSCRCSRR